MPGTDDQALGKTTGTHAETTEVPRRHRPWWTNLWDTFDKPPVERKLLFKVDAALLTFACLGYFLKNLDQANINNAFVSGMREELDMRNNQLTTATTIWTIGYVVGQIPSNLILTRLSPSVWIPFLELSWGICTLATYSVKSYQSLYVLRFFVGLFESGFYPGQQYVLGCWYKPEELGKRAVLFHTAGGIGSMFSGFLQTAAHKGLDGKYGLSGWRWLMIVDGIITVPIALFGFFFYPPLPYQAKPSWKFSQADIDLANARMAGVKRTGKGSLNFKKAKKILQSWEIYLFSLLYICWNNSVSTQNVMAFWLKYSTHPKYTVSQINLYPLPITGIYVIVAWIMAWTSDTVLRGKRWPWIMFTSTFNGIICVALAATPVYGNRRSRWALYYMTGVSGGLSGLFFAWANEVCTRDNEQRALVTASMNDLAYVVQAVIPNFVWKQTSYPKALEGEIYSACLSFTVPIIAMMGVYLERRTDLRRLNAGGETSSSQGSALEGRPSQDGEDSESDHRKVLI